MITRYLNPWHKPGDSRTGPEYYETNARPRTVAGLLIYRRLAQVYDVVRDGVCLCQRAGPTSARDAAKRLAKSRKLRRKCA